MKRITPFLLLLVFGLATALIGCDSSDTPAPPDTLVGTWNAEGANVIISGVSLPVYEAGDEGTLAITFGEDTFSFVAEGPIEGSSPIPGVPPVVVLAEGEGATISGTYTYMANDGLVTFTPAEVDGQPIETGASVPLPIANEDDDTVVISVENTPEGRAFLTFLLGETVPQEIIEAIDGGAITFRRNS